MNEPQQQPIYNKAIPYPTIMQAWTIFGVVLLGQIVASPLQLLLGTKVSGLSTFLMYTAALSIGLLFALWQRKAYRAFTIRAQDPLFEGDPVSAKVYFLLTLLPFGIMLISGPISSLLPVPEAFLEQIDKVLGDFGIFEMLTIVIAAPIFEELIFRGIILDGFLRQMSPKKAILYSAFLFALIHMNPWQFAHTFLLGAGIGWVYFRTKSIWPCIWIHFVNNGMVFLAGSMANNSMMEQAQSAPSSFLGLLVVPIGVLIVYGLVNVLDETIGRNQSEWLTAQEDEEE